MKTLEHQLADYGEHQRELHGPISPEELVTRLGRTDDGAFVRVLSPSRPPAGPRPRRPWLVALSAAAAVLVLVGGAALLFRVIGSDTPVATTPPIDSFSSLTWSRVADDEAVFGGEGGQWISSVTPGGPGLVAVGADGTPDNDAAVWTSPDGVTWSRVPHDESIFGGEHGQTMTAVIAGGPGLVAVGETHVPSLAAVWVSDDGITWSAVPHDEAVFGRANMYAVTVAGSGLIAVGVNESFGIDAGVWSWGG